MQDGRLAPEVAADPRGGDGRVGDVGVDPLRRDPVPLAPAREQRPQHRSRQRRCGPPASLRAPTTRSGTGCGSSRRARRRGRPARRAPTRSRTRRRRRSRAGRATRCAAGRAAAAAGRCARSGAGAEGTTRCGERAAKRPSVPRLVVDGGEDVGLRPGVADRREDPLGAAQVEQEVVDERDARHGAPSYVPDVARRPACPRLWRLIWPAAAAAARREVPRGWLGVVADGPLTEPGFTAAERVGPAGRQRRRERAHARSAGARSSRTGPPTPISARPTRSCWPPRPARARRPAGAPGHAGVGRAEPRRSGLPAARSGGLRPPAGRAGRALRADRLALGRASRGRRATDPRLAGLERAEPDALLERGAVGAVLRRADEGRRTRRSPPPTLARRRSWRGCRTRAGARCARSTRPAGADRSTSSRCTPTPPCPRTWSGSCASPGACCAATATR